MPECIFRRDQLAGDISIGVDLVQPEILAADQYREVGDLRPADHQVMMNLQQVLQRDLVGPRLAPAVRGARCLDFENALRVGRVCAPDLPVEMRNHEFKRRVAQHRQGFHCAPGAPRILVADDRFEQRAPQHGLIAGGRRRLSELL
jgi:hypothetical protein